MSPLIQRPRPGAADPFAQHWSMLVFESLSAGVMAVAVGLLAVMVVVGFYVIIVWPLTFWDLANLGLERFASWTSTVLWSVFAGGTLAGFWCFSGLAFRKNPQRRGTVAPRR